MVPLPLVIFFGLLGPSIALTSLMIQQRQRTRGLEFQRLSRIKAEDLRHPLKEMVLAILNEDLAERYKYVFFVRLHNIGNAILPTDQFTPIVFLFKGEARIGWCSILETQPHYVESSLTFSESKIEMGKFLINRGTSVDIAILVAGGYFELPAPYANIVDIEKIKVYKARQRLITFGGITYIAFVLYGLTSLLSDTSSNNSFTLGQFDWLSPSSAGFGALTTILVILNVLTAYAFVYEFISLLVEARRTRTRLLSKLEVALREQSM